MAGDDGDDDAFQMPPSDNDDNHNGYDGEDDDGW